MSQCRDSRILSFRPLAFGCVPVGADMNSPEIIVIVIVIVIVILAPCHQQA